MTIHSVTTLIMIVDGKNWEKSHFLNFDNFFNEIADFWETHFLYFLSYLRNYLTYRDVDTIPHFNHLKELITPLLQCNCRRICQFWDIRSNVFPIYFTHTLSNLKSKVSAFKSNITVDTMFWDYGQFTQLQIHWNQLI